MAKQRSIASKFILIVSIITQLLVVVLAAVVISSASKSQSLQAESFLATLNSEQAQQEQLLRQGLIRKGESMTALLSQTAAGLIIGYDFDSLQKLANSAATDPDIAYVTFYGKGRNALTSGARQEKGNLHIIKQEIKFEGEVVGFVETGLSFASAEKSIEALQNRITEKDGEIHHQMHAAAWGLGLRILIATGIIVAVMCAIIYFCLSRFVIKPVDKIIMGLDDSATQFTSASGQLSAASHTLSDGAAEQAASMEEISASLEEVSTMTRHNADNASQCDSLMKEVNKVVDVANQSMTDQTAAMGEISKASEETSKIIKTIDEIAFQTNLLALNAAVEAARAGDAGAGFAVVAGEVRSLAMRAAEAAKDTANLIEGTVRKVKEGESLAVKTNKDFAEVAEMAAKVGSLVSEIAEASNEQMQGIQQVNQAMLEIDQVTQRTSASAEESASASEELNGQAEQLKRYVQELVVLVQGSDMRRQSTVTPSSKSGGAEQKPEVRMQLALSEPPNKAEKPSETKKKEELKTKAQARDEALKEDFKSVVAPAVKPEEIIPLEEEEFEDF